MHTMRNRILLFGGTLAAGCASLGLHRYMMETCFDSKGLLISGNLPGKLLWAVGIAFGMMLLLTLRSLGGDGNYEDNFPVSWTGGGLMLAAGVVMAWAVPGLELDAQPPTAQGLSLVAANAIGWAARYLPWAAAACMAVLGGFRMAGKRPWPLLSGVICLFYMLMLVTNYRLWSADPRLHTYAYQMLAEVLLMLAAFHRTCCDAQIIQRRKLLGTGLGAAVCCMAALSGDFQWRFFLASGLWALGSMCRVSTLPPDPEEEEEETTPPTEAETE